MGGQERPKKRSRANNKTKSPGEKLGKTLRWLLSFRPSLDLEARGNRHVKKVAQKLQKPKTSGLPKLQDSPTAEDLKTAWPHRASRPTTRCCTRPSDRTRLRNRTRPWQLGATSGDRNRPPSSEPLPPPRPPNSSCSIVPPSHALPSLLPLWLYTRSLRLGFPSHGRASTPSTPSRESPDIAK